MLQTKVPENPARDRFARRFSAAGVLVPVILLIVGYSGRPWNPGGLIGNLRVVIVWIIWPSWILLFDAEHLPQIVFDLVVAVGLNGLWYWIVGLVVWEFRNRPRSAVCAGGRKGQ